MVFLYVLAGIAVGFLMAVPIGAVGILCVRRTLEGGRRQGYITGIAGASADLVFCLISASGIKLIEDFISDHRYEIRLAGGIILLAMGVLLIRSRHMPARTGDRMLEKTGIFLSTFLVGITNPLVMFSYAALLALVGVESLEISVLGIFFAGIFLGSFLWFVFISNLSHRFRASMTPAKLAIVNRLAGILLIIIGIGAVWYGVGGIT